MYAFAHPIPTHIHQNQPASSPLQRSSGLAHQQHNSHTKSVAQLQALANNSSQVERTAQLQTMANNTGLPDRLKSGIEQLSGYSMNDVKVHYNSDKPAQLQAHAYAQGTEIHVASGQEKHLPHEAWHVVQQKQGRVQPTMQLKGKVAVNDDAGLEQEADVMGARALSISESNIFQRKTDHSASSTTTVVQREKTISGHGNLRRDPLTKALVPYTVPHGKTILLSAPPGATLGDISMVLNTTNNPDPVTMRSLIKISTTIDLWSNIPVVTIIKNNATIPKTPLQNTILTNLIAGTNTYSTLTGGQKGSLTSLEKKPEFETWADGYVKPETFKILNAGDAMSDMQFSAFEPQLKSGVSAAQNEYVAANINLSDYVASKPSENKIVINACSYDPNATFTGFQIDKK